MECEAEPLDIWISIRTREARAGSCSGCKSNRSYALSCKTVSNEVVRALRALTIKTEMAELFVWAWFLTFLQAYAAFGASSVARDFEAKFVEIATPACV